MCRLHAARPENVQDARGKLAQKFAHRPREAMTDEVVDALVLQARLDDAGLAQSARKVLDQEAVPEPLPVCQTSPRASSRVTLEPFCITTYRAYGRARMAVATLSRSRCSSTANGG